uniref:F-box domain-containing protein n=1 Tax=Graphocephala atropunctata TaxID=36148 RepID=A0A1B6MJ69_9HEMI
MTETLQTTIWDLPDEVLHLIFSNLDPSDIISPVKDVCTRWRSIVEKDLLFWNHLQVVIHCDWFLDWGFIRQPSDGPIPLVPQSHFSHEYRQTTGEIYIGEKDLTKVSKVRCIKLEGGSNKCGGHPSQIVLWILEKVKKVCKDIIKVEFCNCLAAFSRDFINLLNDSFNITELKFGVTAVYRIPYEELLHFRNLTSLITSDFGFKKTELSLIADSCDKLESLWVLLSKAIKNDDIIYFVEKKKETLKELGIGLIVTDILLAKVNECHKLNVLFIGDSRCITEKGLSHLTNLPNLKYISFHRAKISLDHIKDWASTSTVPHQLSLLDLSFYGSLKLHQNQITKICPVTFKNHVMKNVSDCYKKPAKPRMHWMYRYVDIEPLGT